MKKTIGLCILILIFFINISSALASTGVAVGKTSVLPGGTVSISGAAGAGESIVIKITDEAGNIVFFDAVKADTSGKYSASFVVPSDMAAGKLTVTAGSGNDVATITITVKPKPTAKPASTPQSSSTLEPMAVPSSSTSPGTTQASGDDTSPSADKPSAIPSNQDKGDIITPKEISQDKVTGVITIVIDVDGLPEGTAAIETPGGEILYISDAQNGVLVIKVAKGDVNADGDIEITLLSDEMTPLSTTRIHVLNENGEIAKTGENSMSGWMVAIYIAVGLVILLAVLWILNRRRNKQEKAD